MGREFGGVTGGGVKFQYSVIVFRGLKAASSDNILGCLDGSFSSVTMCERGGEVWVYEVFVAKFSEETGIHLRSAVRTSPDRETHKRTPVEERAGQVCG